MTTMTDERRDMQVLVAELTAAGARITNPASFCCPFHDDRNPSSGLYEEDGIWRFKCHGGSCGFGGDIYDVRAKARNMRVEDVLKQSKQRPMMKTKPKRTYATLEDLCAAFNGRLQARYIYTDPQTREAQLIVLRASTAKGGKDFFQYHTEGGRVVSGACAKPWPLYNRGRVAQADSVLVVEGEKCVHALHKLGLVATTSPCGAGKASHADWTPLVGKAVYLWPDNDKPGLDHMADVEGILLALNPPARVYRMGLADLELPEAGDVCDLIARYAERHDGGDVARAVIDDLMGEAEPVGASSGLKQLIDDTLAGRRFAVPWPWNSETVNLLGKLTKALLPGTLTLLCGDPGATKSFAILEAAIFWEAKGYNPAVFALEEDRAYHLNRALAQLDGNGKLTDDEWMKEHPDDTLAAYATHRANLDRIGRLIWDAPDHQITFSQLLDWIEQRGQAGHRIIAVDPVTAVETSDKQWLDDKNFVIAAKALARKYDNSLVFVTHPKKARGPGMPSMDDLAGGTAWVRFSQTVLWLSAHYPPKTVKILRKDLSHHACEINRTLTINKARNGKGAGAQIGYLFDGGTLRFMERGLIDREAE